MQNLDLQFLASMILIAAPHPGDKALSRVRIARHRPEMEVKGKLTLNPEPGEFFKLWGKQIGRRPGIVR
jgi:hypothetical protein